MFCFFLFKQKTAYEMRISDWSSDVCSSDLQILDRSHHLPEIGVPLPDPGRLVVMAVGRLAVAGHGDGEVAAGRRRAADMVVVAAEADGDGARDGRVQIGRA